MDLSTLTPIALFGLVSFVGTTVTKYVLDLLGVALKKGAPLLTLLIVYVWSFAQVWLFAGTRFGEKIDVIGVSVASLNMAEIVLVAMAVMAFGVGLDKLIKARDTTQTAATPSLAAPPAVADANTAPANIGAYFEPGPNPNG